MRVRGVPRLGSLIGGSGVLLLGAGLWWLAVPGVAGEDSRSADRRAESQAAVERGYQALTRTAFVPGFWSVHSVERAWQQWGVPEKPADYAAAFRQRYGLHPAPY
ncbi:MAG: hypothetical protein WHU94_16595, partial [Thermogemmata sp.]